MGARANRLVEEMQEVKEVEEGNPFNQQLAATFAIALALGDVADAIRESTRQREAQRYGITFEPDGE